MTPHARPSLPASPWAGWEPPKKSPALSCGWPAMTPNSLPGRISLSTAALQFRRLSDALTPRHGWEEKTIHAGDFSHCASSGDHRLDRARPAADGLDAGRSWPDHLLNGCWHASAVAGQ